MLSKDHGIQDMEDAKERLSKATQRPTPARQKPEQKFWLDEDETGEADFISLNECEIRTYAAKNRMSFEKARCELGRQQSGGQ